MGYPFVLPFATTSLAGLHCLCLYVSWHLTNQQTKSYTCKEIKYCVTDFKTFFNILPTSQWCVAHGCSTPPHHSPAAKQFLVDYSGFTLHSQTHTQAQGIKWGVRHSNHFHSYGCLRMWQNLKSKYNVRLCERADIPGWARQYFRKLFYWFYYMNGLYIYPYSSQWLSFMQDGKDFLGNWLQFPRQSLLQYDSMGFAYFSSSVWRLRASAEAAWPQLMVFSHNRRWQQ